MSAHNPRLQFVTRLSDSPKIEAKWVVLVKGPWYETSSSRRLSFHLNQSLSLPGLFQLGGTCTPLGRMCFDMPQFYEILTCFDMPFFSEIFVSRRRRDLLVRWVEKASLKHIRRLLEIIEGEHNHELLLSVKNLRELGASPFPYIVPVIPRPLPTELIRGKHFVLVDLLKSIPGSSSQVGDGQEPQAETAQGALVSPKPAPRWRRRRREKRQRRLDKSRLSA